MNRSKYTEEDVAIIKKYYPIMDNQSVAEMMSVPTTAEQIRCYANRHSIIKSEKYLRALSIRRARAMHKAIAKKKKLDGYPSDLMRELSEIKYNSDHLMIKWQEHWTHANIRTCLHRVNKVNEARTSKPFRIHGHCRLVTGYIVLDIERL